MNARNKSMALLSFYMMAGMGAIDGLGSLGPGGPRRDTRTRIGFDLRNEQPGKPTGGNCNKKNPVRKANRKRRKKRGY